MNIEVKRCQEIHQKSEHATHPIMQFLSFPALFLLLAWNGHAASSPLQGASAAASADCFAGSQHAARDPRSTLTGKLKNYTLKRVQLRNLGL